MNHQCINQSDFLFTEIAHNGLEFNLYNLMNFPEIHFDIIMNSEKISRENAGEEMLLQKLFHPIYLVLHSAFKSRFTGYFD